MGNFVSCTHMVTPLIMNKSSKTRSITVVFPDGEIRQFRGQTVIAAAELMFECPNFFLANSRSLHVGRRFSALSADEELEIGNLYIMFPMKKLNSMITAVDMAPLRLMGVQVSCENKNDRQGMEFEDPGPAQIDEAQWQSTAPIYKPRLSACGSRKPLLETIREDPVCSR
ncbi:hypothetical protein CDL15_Pgr011081 [Punica granatum]|uniref:DUF4228 domain-containing protein n=1 Tax=Punica granatum TaxID=22663 RepID=A0A218XMN7_PUNGR|nr:hypothetical protein CDL15_Pgr011081 [Punica granatum]PKI44304.1 hypothetical protein CRG98_035378 [Punica granatum]